MLKANAKWYLAGVGVALINGALSYLACSSWIMACIITFVFMIALFSLVIPSCIKKEEQEVKRHECYRFTTAFLVSLSVTKSPDKAYESASADLGASPGLAKAMTGITELTVDQKLDYLNSYFEVKYYPMFISIFQCYQEQGGDVLKIAEPLMKEISRFEEFQNSVSSESRLRLFQFMSLWLLSGGIVVIIRYSLRDYYRYFLSSPAYLAVVALYFAVALASFIIYAAAYTGIKPKLLRRGSRARTQKKRG